MTADLVSDFVDWYVAMLRAAMPQPLRRWLSRVQRGLLVVAAADGAAEDATVIETKRGRERRLGRLGALLARAALPARRRATVRLPAGAAPILMRETVLPLAVERSLPTALAHEMDRLTPFDAGEVLWHAEVLRRDREAGTLRLRLAILPRRRIAALLDLLAGTRLSVVAVEGEVGGALRRLPLDNDGRRAVGTRPLAGLCAALALLVLLIPPIRQQFALARTDAEMAGLAPKLHRAEILRRDLAQDTAGAAALATQRRRRGATLHALAAVTRALPDGSYLTDLTLHHGTAILDGESPNAAKLIAGFAGNPQFADPQFAAPVTRAINGSEDVFVIRVRLRDAAARAADAKTVR